MPAGGLSRERRLTSNSANGTPEIALLVILVDAAGNPIGSIGGGGGGTQYAAGATTSPATGNVILGRVVDLAALPTYTLGQLREPSIDTNGAMLVNVGAIAESDVATISITSTDTSYVFGTAINLRGYNSISIIPRVTTPGGTTGFYKVQWSFDNINYWDETVDSDGPPSGNETVITQNTMVRSFASNSPGYKPNSGFSTDKKAQYIKIGQKSDGVASLTTGYDYQRF